MYLDAMDAVDRIKPGAALFVLEGPLQERPAGAAVDQWGNGFTANPALISRGLSGRCV